jgi:hypothetical protein
MTAIKVEVVGRGMNKPVSLARNSLDVCRRDPDQNNRVLCESNVVLKQHLLPDDGCLALLCEGGVRRLCESVERFLECLACGVE